MNKIRRNSKKFESSKFENCPRKVLLEACSEGSAERVEALLKSQTFIDNAVINGDHQNLEKVPLYVVVSNYLDDERSHGYKKVFDLLMKNGADPYKADHTGTTIAAKILREKIQLIDILLEYTTDFNRGLACFGFTALHIAVESCTVHVVMKLLKKNADPNAATTFGLTVLQNAVLHERLDLIDILIRHGANVNKPNLDGFQSLHFAKSEKMVRKLVEYGALTNSRCSLCGDTPLSFAVRNRRKSEVISALLDCGANHAIFDHTRLTPFDYVQRNMVIGKNLVEYGQIADVFMEHVRSKIPVGVKDELTQRIRTFHRELSKARTETMGNSTVTFWKIMNSSEREVANYLRNEEILEAIINNEFKLFRYPIMKMFFIGIDRMIGEDMIRNALYKIFQGILPIHIVNIIISYLSKEDWEYLREILNNS